MHKQAVRPPHFIGVALHRLLHAQRREAGSQRVILMGERGAEERHVPIAHDLIDRAFIAVDGRHHALQHGVEELACFFGITVGEQLHGALEVGKKHSDLLALAFEGRLGVENLLSEVLRSVRIGRRELA